MIKLIYIVKLAYLHFQEKKRESKEIVTVVKVIIAVVELFLIILADLVFKAYL